jgi:hypothetical protein
MLANFLGVLPILISLLWALTFIFSQYFGFLIRDAQRGKSYGNIAKSEKL